MKENKLDLIVIVILFILLLNSFVLSYFYFQAYQKNEPTEVVAKEAITNEVTTENESNISTEELMNKIYPKDTFKDGTVEYSVYHTDRAVGLMYDEKHKIMSANNCTVYLFEGEYQITRDNDNIQNEDHRQDIIIKNLPADKVVDVLINSDEEGSDYAGIFFLTRDGDIYYVKYVGYSEKSVNAAKIDNISNVIRMEREAYAIKDDASHSYSTILGIDINGNVYDLEMMAYENGLIG